MAWTDYYKFHTIDGDIYCSQEKQITDRKDMVEYFTKLPCNLSINTLFVSAEFDKYKLLKNEILAARPDFETYIKFKPVVDYTYLSFKGDKMLEYVIDPFEANDNVDHVFHNNIDEYKRISEEEFNSEVQSIINKYGEEEMKAEILNRINKRKSLYKSLEK